MDHARVSPFQTYLQGLHDALRNMREGAVADYIPELAKTAPDNFGLSFATIDGEVYSVGDSHTEFSIQSVSKPFAYASALRDLGPEAVLKRVGVEPTGEAFNSIVLDQDKNRPFNPMVNAGAIAIAALTKGATQNDRVENMRQLFSSFAGRELEIDQDVYVSEKETGHRNRAIAYLMLNSGMIDRAPEEVLDLYFQQCALRVTTEDLAIMGAVLANGGVNPRTQERVLGAEEVRDVLTLMMTCGMYDYAGEWSYEVGLPAKSGVSGGVLAILPGQLSVAIWSPPLDAIGNSVRGIEACRQISRDFGLHLFMNAAAVEGVVRRISGANHQQSMRIRNPRDRDVLIEQGHRIALVELQGTLYFASSERMIRQLDALPDDMEFLLLDFRRLNAIDAAACRFFSDFLERKLADGVEITFSDLPDNRPDVHAALSELAKAHGLPVAETLDTGLEACENQLLKDLRQPFDFTNFSLSRISLFAGLEPDEIAAVQALIQPVQFSGNEVILSGGATGDTLFVLARGTVGVWVDDASGSRMRVGGMGPGQFFGEMAALGGGVRSADVVADETVVCYGLMKGQIDALGMSHPKALTKILANLAREFGNRLRQSNTLISTLK
ncbi:MAG: glutaminase A [Pseudomonadota bacterium]